MFSRLLGFMKIKPDRNNERGHEHLRPQKGDGGEGVIPRKLMEGRG